jgi:hypothetical protein
MTELTVVSSATGSIKPFVEAALLHEARLFEVAIRQTEVRIHQFEEQYGLTTAQFLAKYAQDKHQHSFDFDDWIGESRMLARLGEKLEILRGIDIAN